jgi:hypothetical protein
MKKIATYFETGFGVVQGPKLGSLGVDMGLLSGRLLVGILELSGSRSSVGIAGKFHLLLGLRLLKYQINRCHLRICLS